MSKTNDMVRLLVLIIFLGLPMQIAHAHGGGLDANGCHHDRKKGGYHCHRGPVAGQSFPDRAAAERALQQLKK